MVSDFYHPWAYVSNPATTEIGLDGFNLDFRPDADDRSKLKQTLTFEAARRFLSEVEAYDLLFVKSPFLRPISSLRNRNPLLNATQIREGVAVTHRFEKLLMQSQKKVDPSTVDYMSRFQPALGTHQSSASAVV